MVSPFLPESEKVAAVRAELPATGAGIYLNTGTAGPLLLVADAAMRETAERELRVGRADPAGWEEVEQRRAEARATVGAIVGAPVGSVALTHCTTDGMNVATWAIDWRPGDRAVTSRFEHPGGLGPLLTVRDRLGVDLELADLGDGGDDVRTLAALDRAIIPGTRLVALSHVAWTNGAVLPIAEIARLAHERGARIAVDGAQSAGAIPVDVTALGVDFYAVPGQKWLLGPEGTGALYLDPASLEAAAQTFAGWGTYSTCLPDGTADRWPDARRFETAGFHAPSVAGFARSAGWLAMHVGLAWVQERGARLARLAADLLAAVPGVTLLTPRDRMATLVTFRVAGWPAEALREELGRRVFAITRTIAALDALRISVGFFNTDEELRRFVVAVGELAATTPDRLPPRPPLAILAADEG
ncbi:MAG: hypothetical protein A2X23_11020 [Chloroflexi bacterium GWC2_73_18]|nr:MAG: hypothetical protein A2X23_11020 [Chloroflexi bacterium GWC2_73_18]